VSERIQPRRYRFCDTGECWSEANGNDEYAREEGGGVRDDPGLCSVHGDTSSGGFDNRRTRPSRLLHRRLPARLSPTERKQRSRW